MEKDIGAEVRLLEQMQRSRHQGVGTEFESLQPFRLGDDPRRIDWRATARQQSLVVRHFQIERHRDVMIIIDSGRLMGVKVGDGSKLDCAVDSALNLCSRRSAKRGPVRRSGLRPQVEGFCRH